MPSPIGCDIASTTLSHPGAAIDCGMADGPDVALVRQATTEFPDKPVICEGRVHTPADAKAAMDAGAWAVVVGTAITHPTSITSWFVEAVEGKSTPSRVNPGTKDEASHSVVRDQ